MAEHDWDHILRPRRIPSRAGRAFPGLPDARRLTSMPFAWFGVAEHAVPITRRPSETEKPETVGELYDRVPPTGEWVDVPEYGIRAARWESLREPCGHRRPVNGCVCCDWTVGQAAARTVGMTERQVVATESVASLDGTNRLDRVMPDTGTPPDEPTYTRSEVDEAISVALRRIVAVMDERQEFDSVAAVYRAAAEVGVSAEEPEEPAVEPVDKRPVDWP